MSIYSAAVNPEESSPWALFFFASTDTSLIADFDGRILNANPAAVACLGFAREELVGARLIDFVADESHAAVSEILGKLAHEGGSHRLAAKILCKDRSRKNLDITLAAIMDRGLIKAVGREIIALTSAEQELDRIRCEYEAILNAISEGIHWVGAEGVIRYENPAAAAMLGYEVSELIGQRAHPVMHHHRADGSVFPVEECSIYATLHDGQTRRVGNEVFWRKDGTSFPVQYTCMPTHDPDGRPNGSVVTFVDITERKKFQAALQNARLAAEASSRAKSEFLGNMSHEFRTPLNGVIGLSEQLLATSLDQRQRECANMIRLSGESLLIIANNILDFSKIEHRTLKLEMTEFDPREMLRQVTDLFQPPAQAKGVHLEAVVAPEVPLQVQGDAGRLRQILSNLLSNAVKFTQQGEVGVSVSLLRETPTEISLRFEVRDTGLGIAPEAQSRLFEAFSQEDNSNTRRYGGGGLGLAISRRLVELMSGKIDLESAPGRGSRFTFEVTFGRKAAPATATAHKDLHGLHLLVVADDEANRDRLNACFAAWKIRTAIASTEEETMLSLRRCVVDDPFELVVISLKDAALDLAMARTIRKEPLLASSKVVLLTAEDQALDPAEARAAAIAGVLTRSVSPDRLLAQLTRVMSGDVLQRTKQIALSGSLPKQYREIRLKKEIKILLAEDNRVNQVVFLGVLQKLGYGASLANNGVEAVKAIAKDDFDLIFMDCQMPEMDGYEATRQIRAGKWRQPRIVAITANTLLGDDEKCRGAGMDDYMPKPVRLDKLREMLERWLPR